MYVCCGFIYILITNINPLGCISLACRYRTTVSSAREVSIIIHKIVRTETDMSQYDWLLLIYK